MDTKCCYSTPYHTKRWNNPLKVSDLIDPNLGTWDRELVNDIFWEEDAKHILSIPIRPDMEDTIAWHFDPKGTFSVKSAYHVLEENKQRDQEKQRGESSKAPVQVEF